MVVRQARIIMMLAVAIASVAGAMEYERARYEVIVDRSPFGEDPLSAQEAAEDVREARAAAAEAKKMEKEIRLCYLLETESGEIRAGFENKTAKQGDPKSIMLMVGENFKGMKLTSIDLANSSATLSVKGKPLTFTLTKAAAPAAKAPTAAPQRRFGSGFRREAPPQPPKPTEPVLSPEERAKKRAEVRENLRQYQMEVIRAGMPPLPIPLTQDMDDQLVAEGMLPPAEQ